MLEHDAVVADAGWRELIGGHLQSLGQQAAITSVASGRYRIDYAHRRQPRVSLLLVAGERLPLLQRCVISLLEKTDWPDYELLLLDNGAGEAVARWLQHIATLGDPRLRLFALDHALPLAQARNLLAAQSSAELLLFVDEELAPVQPDWLAAMVNQALRADVGAVGARSVGADGRITHAGVLPGVLAGSGRAFLGEPISAPGYSERLQAAQTYSAVAGHCLMLGRAHFEALGGFDA